MSQEIPKPKAEIFDLRRVGNLPLLLTVLSAIGLIVSAIGAIVPSLRVQFAHSWLFAFFYFFTLGAGSLFWILVHHATDAEWSVVVRRVLENVAALLPKIFLAVVPVLLCAPILYHWWNIAPGVDELIDKKHNYLNTPFFLIRAAIYFGVFTFLATTLKRLSVKQDTDGSPRHTISLRRLTFPGIALFAVCLTFAAIDWLMSLDYKWVSTMWGVYIFAGAAGSSMSLLVLLVTWLRKLGYMSYVTEEHYHIMGKLMLAFCVFWAYIGFSQYMLIWYADIPEETRYFIRRNIGTWNYLSTILVAFRFFIPFPILLMQPLKKKPVWICSVAALLVTMQALDLYIIVMPMLHKTGYSLAALPFDVAALLAIGGPLALLFLKGLGKQSLVPVRDPRLELSLKLTN